LNWPLVYHAHRLDFDGLGGAELLVFARGLGSDGLLLQELAAVEDSSVRELLDVWTSVA
jgi:hypothetical protein